MQPENDTAPCAGNLPPISHLLLDHQANVLSMPFDAYPGSDMRAAIDDPQAPISPLLSETSRQQHAGFSGTGQVHLVDRTELDDAMSVNSFDKVKADFAQLLRRGTSPQLYADTAEAWIRASMQGGQLWVARDKTTRGLLGIMPIVPSTEALSATSACGEQYVRQSGGHMSVEAQEQDQAKFWNTTMSRALRETTTSGPRAIMCVWNDDALQPLLAASEAHQTSWLAMTVGGKTNVDTLIKRGWREVCHTRTPTIPDQYDIDSITLVRPPPSEVPDSTWWTNMSLPLAYGFVGKRRYCKDIVTELNKHMQTHLWDAYKSVPGIVKTASGISGMADGVLRKAYSDEADSAARTLMNSLGERGLRIISD